MTLFVQPQGGNRYLMATVLDRGPSSSEWIKVQLPNGEEAFCYPDTDFSFDIKKLEPATQIAICVPRACKKPGATKWTCNALHANLQPNRENFATVSQLNIDVLDINDAHTKEASEDVSDTKEASEITKERKSLPSITVRRSKARYEFIYQVMEREGFEGKYAKSDAAAFIIDKCMQEGIL